MALEGRGGGKRWHLRIGEATREALEGRGGGKRGEGIEALEVSEGQQFTDQGALRNIRE